MAVDAIVTASNTETVLTGSTLSTLDHTNRSES